MSLLEFSHHDKSREMSLCFSCLYFLYVVFFFFAVFTLFLMLISFFSLIHRICFHACFLFFLVKVKREII